MGIGADDDETAEKVATGLGTDDVVVPEELDGTAVFSANFAISDFAGSEGMIVEGTNTGGTDTSPGKNRAAASVADGVALEAEAVTEGEDGAGI